MGSSLVALYVRVSVWPSSTFSLKEKVNLSLYLTKSHAMKTHRRLIKHNAMKTYGWVEV